MSEARAAAAFAVIKYDKRKAASLETFVYACVKNRLTDIARKEKKSPSLIFTEDDFHQGSILSTDDIDFALTMKKLLSPIEYEVFHHSFVEDCSQSEVSKILQIPRAEVRKCFFHIRRKYLLIEKNHHRILTQRAHTSRWLEDLPA